MKIIKSCLILFTSASVFAQSDPHATIFNNNYSYFNPANSGLKTKHYASITSKNELSGFEFSPRWTSILYDYRLDTVIGNFNGGIGMSYLNHKNGFQNTNTVNLNFNHHRRVGVGVLSIGVSGRIDLIDHLTLIQNADFNQTDISMGFGLVYKTARAKYGLSSVPTALISSSIQDSNPNYTRDRSYYAMASYIYVLSSSIELTPQIFIKTDGKSSTVDLNLMISHHKTHWGGITYRIENEIGLSLGTTLKGYRIGYAYDIPLSTLAVVRNGMHEFTAVVMFN